MWKKEVLHRQEWKSLCKSPKSPCFCEKSPFFDTHAPVGCVDKLSTALWKSGRTGFYPQAPMDKRKNTGGILHRKSSRSYPQRRLWHSRNVKKFKKTVTLSPLLRLSKKYPPRMQEFSTENFGGSEKIACRTWKIPFSTVSTAYTATATGLLLSSQVFSVFSACARVPTGPAPVSRSRGVRQSGIRPNRPSPQAPVIPADPRPPT